jgi:hypothetical protein
MALSALRYDYPDGEGSARSWARSLNLSGLGQRVFFGVPKKPAFPLVIVARVAGRPVRGVPVDRPVIQFDVLGVTPEAGQTPSDKLTLSAIADALVSEAESLASGTVVAPGVVCLGAEVENGPVWSPSPVDRRSRYSLDIAFALRKA